VNDAGPRYLGIDHVQLTIPPGSEDAARRFYCATLGMKEVSRPDSLKGRRGLWLACGQHEVHLGIEESQAESRRHPGILVEALAPLRARLGLAGIETPIDQPPERPGYSRIHLRDPFGNRLEFMEKSQ
jgi:catechol 2,3-dioxygenase-like lactoylglutathione lyase family enzyme